ncbi:TetR/AcrR family transcriptional regulator [Nocardiopsis ansamitocini]|uniref:TetR family transcriptional regulator n=1 Tax=Nocardiopsis ansamitocini TaxID=1670832 RepID=A0A9W6P763_9ACTN|nr:TetR/AcrR family transcriptional regulator [Nocardiopsis ansamitocini]GLU48312.1 TetR family transcriptional regulator [Nocardiopsis ansamitocini]
MTTAPLKRDSRNLRQALMDAASVMLLEASPAPAPSLRAVARACNVSATAVYLHFDSWAALIDAVLDQHFTDVRTRIDSAGRTSAHPRERLDATALAYVLWGLEYPGPYQLLFESTERLKDPGVVDSWSKELIGSMARDLLATGFVGDMAKAVEAVDRLSIALHGIISIRRHKPGRAWSRNVPEEVVGMVEVFAGPPRGLAGER